MAPRTYAAAVGVLATLGVERAMAYCGNFASPFQITEASAAVPTIVGPNICSPGTEATIFGCQPEIAQLEVSFFNEDGDKASVCAEDENGGQCPIGTCVDNINTNFGVGTTPYAETYKFDVEVGCEGTFYPLEDFSNDLFMALAAMVPPFDAFQELSSQLKLETAKPDAANDFEGIRIGEPGALKALLCPGLFDTDAYPQPFGACSSAFQLGYQPTSPSDFEGGSVVANAITGDQRGNLLNPSGPQESANLAAFIFRITTQVDPRGIGTAPESPLDASQITLTAVSCEQMCGVAYCTGGGGGGDPWVQVAGKGELFVDMPADGVTQINLLNHDGGFSINATAYRMPEDPVEMSYFGSIILHQEGHGALTVSPSSLDASVLSTDTAVASLTYTGIGGDTHVIAMPTPGETRVVPGNMTFVCEPLAKDFPGHSCVVTSRDGDVVEVSVIPAEKGASANHMHCDLKVLKNAPGKEMRGIVYANSAQA